MSGLPARGGRQQVLVGAFLHSLPCLHAPCVEQARYEAAGIFSGREGLGAVDGTVTKLGRAALDGGRWLQPTRGDASEELLAEIVSWRLHRRPATSIGAIYGQLEKEDYDIAMKGVLANMVQQVNGGADRCTCALRQHLASPWSMCGDNDRCLKHHKLDRLVFFSSSWSLFAGDPLQARPSTCASSMPGLAWAFLRWCGCAGAGTGAGRHVH